MHTALIVDDHPFIRASVRALLMQQQLKVVAEAENASDALRDVADHDPALIVLDICLPGLNGFEFLESLKKMPQRGKVLILTSQAPSYFSLRCRRAGAKGYVSKSDSLVELGKAAMAVMSGYTYFPDVAYSSVSRVDNSRTEQECLQRLTDRELLVMQHLATGLSNKAIGTLLELSNKTISTYKTRIMEKMRVSSVVDLADIANRHALL